MAPSAATPLAIVAGCALIALGVYFGLRAQPAASPTLAPTDPTAPASASARPSPTEAPSAANAEPPDAEARAGAETALAELKPKLLDACWRALPEPPPSARFVFQSTFDAEGKEIARGISDVRGHEAPEVGACLRRQPLELRIEPPGRRVRFDVPLDLP